MPLAPPAASHLTPGLQPLLLHLCAPSWSSSLHGIHDTVSRCCSPPRKDRQSDRVRQMALHVPQIRSAGARPVCSRLPCCSCIPCAPLALADSPYRWTLRRAPSTRPSACLPTATGAGATPQGPGCSCRCSSTGRSTATCTWWWGATVRGGSCVCGGGGDFASVWKHRRGRSPTTGRIRCLAAQNASEPKAHTRVRRHIAAQHPSGMSNRPRSTGLRAWHAKRAHRLYVTSRMHRQADPLVGRPPAPQRHAARVP